MTLIVNVKGKSGKRNIAFHRYANRYKYVNKHDFNIFQFLTVVRTCIL